MRKIYLTLFSILILAFFLRFYKVTEIPPSLNWDEASIGYNAYSILKTGRDEWGKFLPVHFKAYGEYKLPIQIYISIPAIATFGLNELGVRITPVVYGTLTVLVVFFLASEIFGASSVGLFSAILLAISPWHIQLTRASFESALATFWVVLGTWLLVKGFKRQKWFIVSTIPFALSVFTYNSTRIFTPLFLLTVLILYWKTLMKFKKFILLSAVLFAVLLLPLTPFLLSGDRSARYKLVSITDDPGLIPRINQNRGNSHLPGFLPKLVHNKVTYVASYFTQNYLAHFTPQFLFISGAPHKQHHVQNMGELYYFQAPFLFIGLFGIFKYRNRFRKLLISWILLAFIPVSVTNDSIPNALRTLVAVPFYQIMSGYGFFLVFKWLKNKNLLLKFGSALALLVVMAVNLQNYFYNYYVIYPKAYSRDWQYGYKQVVEYVSEHYKQYDEIVFSRHYGEPHMFTLFFLSYDPAKYQNNPNLVRFETYNWVWVLRFDKFYFPDLGDKGTTYADLAPKYKGRKVLFIGKSGDFPAGLPKLKTVDFLNGSGAFEIVALK